MKYDILVFFEELSEDLIKIWQKLGVLYMKTDVPLYLAKFFLEWELF
jgi:hypothetical protein